MMQVDKEAKRQRAKDYEDYEEELSSSSISMYNLDSGEEGS